MGGGEGGAYLRGGAHFKFWPIGEVLIQRGALIRRFTVSQCNNFSKYFLSILTDHTCMPCWLWKSQRTTGKLIMSSISNSKHNCQPSLLLNLYSI